jgi:hypothetical protein
MFAVGLMHVLPNYGLQTDETRTRWNPASAYAAPRGGDRLRAERGAAALQAASSERASQLNPCPLGGLQKASQSLARSLKKALPIVASALLAEHANEWASTTRGLLSFKRDGRGGATIVLRTPSLGSVRLAAARVFHRLPPGLSWTQVRALTLSSSPRNLLNAKHRYLFVPRRDLPNVVHAMSGSRIRVRTWEES